MKLKSIEINGFKSFAEKTKIDFMPGMTGVVGPNGSGKSNIIEAIRWVMGEQSAKGLRGDKMSDVIFGGSKNRNAMSRASVTMIIDNQDHFLKTDFTEISISRRLYRNGDSEYLINGIKSRLKDITDLFVDTGLGRESFSIINQGKVESIFNAKPEERRTIIEDVAGVFKYKQNKIKTENELSITSDNLARVTDIISEIESRLEPLKIQAQEAQEFSDLQRQYDQLNLVKFLREQKSILKEISELNSNRLNIESQSKTIDEQINEIINNVSTKQINISELEKQISDLSSEIENLTVEIERTRGENKLQNNQLENLSNNKKRLDTLIKENNLQITTLNNNISELEQKKQSVENEFNRLQNDVDGIYEQLKKKDQLSNKDQLESLREEYIQTLIDISNLENKITSLQKDTQRITHRHENLDENNHLIKKEIEDKKEELRHQYGNIDDNSYQQIELNNQSILESLNNAKKQLDNLNTNHLRLLNNFNQNKSRFESLQNSTENSDYYFGVRNVLNAKAQFPGLFGTVAELISVGDENVLAVQTALGAALQNIIVDSQQTAKKAIDYLTQRKLGRVTFLPIDNILSRRIPDDVLITLKNTSGFVGIASKLIKFDSKFSNIFENLLGMLIVADNLENAFNISKITARRYQVVTLRGEIIRAGGAITGGADNNKTGILAKFNEIEQLKELVKQNANDLEDSKKIIDNLQKQIKKEEQDYVVVRNQLVAQKEQTQLSIGGKKILEDKIQSLKQTVNINEKETVNLKNEIKINQQNIIDAQSNLEIISNQSEKKLDQIHQLEISVANNTQESSKQGEELSQKREELAEKRVILQNINSQISEKQNNLSQIKSIQTESQFELEKISAQINDLEQQMKNSSEVDLDNSNLEEMIIKRNSLMEIISSEREKYSENLSKQNQLQDQFRKVTDSLNKVDIKISSLKTKLEQVEVNLHQIDYDKEFNIDLLEDRELIDIAQSVNQLKNQMGNYTHVNLGAIDELAIVSERFDFLNKQKEDLVNSSNDLLLAISELDKEVVTKFGDTFNKVASEFKKTFVKLFGGGSASLELSEPNDLLNTGIEIKVQPPGKKARNLSLLSGGEKALTAIALLLAILLVNPVPFAILDETEAALDESNVDNFGKFIAEFGKQTQFIVITHRKPTMKYANVLYGVTMQEPGVSTMVSVSLDEVKD
ncbi:MAG: chromosome segregation protein SMC [Lactobacillaceae bacterium]|jgi:chromosome segregation protein|nr:chromosome segregation protein SMC [Lactobacillaceae bacterium]